MLPSRCATEQVRPDQSVASRSASEPACVSVMKGAEPGVARVQAVRLNSEIRIVVVDEDNLPPEGRESRRDALNGRQQSSLTSRQVREDTTGV